MCVHSVVACMCMRLWFSVLYLFSSFSVIDPRLLSSHTALALKMKSVAQMRVPRRSATSLKWWLPTGRLVSPRARRALVVICTQAGT
jgi:hypothetical protein